MGRNSSGTRGGLQPGDATYKGSVGKPEPLVNMKDPALYKATKEAISRYLTLSCRTWCKAKECKVGRAIGWHLWRTRYG